MGLVSHGRDSSCGSEAMPSLYTDLTYFKSWITDQVKLLESIPKEKCDEDKLKEKLRRRKRKNKLKNENASKLMKLIPLPKRTNVQEIFFEAWPIFNLPFR